MNRVWNTNETMTLPANTVSSTPSLGNGSSGTMPLNQPERPQPTTSSSKIYIYNKPADPTDRKLCDCML